MNVVSFQNTAGEWYGWFGTTVGSCVKETEGEDPGRPQQQTVQTQISLVSAPSSCLTHKRRALRGVRVLRHTMLSLLGSSKSALLWLSYYLFVIFTLFIGTLINCIWRGRSWSTAKAKCHKHKAIKIMFYFVFKHKCIFSWVSRKTPLFWSQTVGEIPAVSLLWSLGAGWTSCD